MLVTKGRTVMYVSEFVRIIASKKALRCPTAPPVSRSRLASSMGYSSAALWLTVGSVSLSCLPRHKGVPALAIANRAGREAVPAGKLKGPALKAEKVLQCTACLQAAESWASQAGSEGFVAGS